MEAIYGVANNALPYLSVYLTYYNPVRRLSDFYKNLQYLSLQKLLGKHEFLEMAQ
jgi:hypothetical protein